MAYSYDAFTDKQNELAFDLRQVYVKIVAEHLEDVADARRARNYVVYLRALKNLETIIRHKIKDKKALNENNEKVNCLEVYHQLLNEISKLAIAYPGIWNGKLNNPSVMNRFEDLLNRIEKLLWEMMEDAKMFGSGQTFEGL